MKHIKKFETKEEDEDELLADLLAENPDNETHDFYIFLASEKFEEAENGLYKKTIAIENMVRITGDKQSVNAMQMLQMRARLQHDAILYHIWLPKEIREDVEGKGSNIEPWLAELINKYKRRGDPTGEGRKILNDVKQRRKDIKKYNL